MRAMRDVWGETLATIAEDDERLVVLDGDLANSTKADIVAEAHPDRFLQMGIAEQNLVGAAVGMATMGYVPWLSSFAVFLTHRALDQVRMLVAQTGANVKIAGSYSGILTGLTGRTHQDVQDLAIMRAMPGMTVLAPADAAECTAMIRWACDYEGPVYLRLARDPERDVFPDGVTFVPRMVRRLRSGGDVTLVSTGTQTARVVGAAELLEEAGVRAGVVHVPCLKPLDEDALLRELADTPLVVTVEEHTVLGGLGGLVAEIVAGSDNRVRVERIGLQDVWGESAPNDFLLDRYGLSSTRVAERVGALIGSRVQRVH
jgi:transketolase